MLDPGFSLRPERDPAVQREEGREQASKESSHYKDRHRYDWWSWIRAASLKRQLKDFRDNTGRD